jgi:hypothetical protein
LLLLISEEARVGCFEVTALSWDLNLGNCGAFRFFPDRLFLVTDGSKFLINSLPGDLLCLTVI